MTNRYLYTPVNAVPFSVVTLGISSEFPVMLSLVDAFLGLLLGIAFTARLTEKQSHIFLCNQKSLCSALSPSLFPTLASKRPWLP